MWKGHRFSHWLDLPLNLNCDHTLGLDIWKLFIYLFILIIRPTNISHSVTPHWVCNSVTREVFPSPWKIILPHQHHFQLSPSLVNLSYANYSWYTAGNHKAAVSFIKDKERKKNTRQNGKLTTGTPWWPKMIQDQSHSNNIIQRHQSLNQSSLHSSVPVPRPIKWVHITQPASTCIRVVQTGI